ncbi:cell death abnormality protein 1-like [Ostrea edulis]|uniref:cell death abnormality protein 1-like n=1 Tax=Ostrea edulis TaxID=37623 RepID=UPI0024AE9DBA|nr:cell death abnormality protein 1-like [Ostrea edulis]
MAVHGLICLILLIGCIHCYDDWLQIRFKYFYLDVSNSSAAVTTTSERTRCYTDRSMGLPDNVIGIPCNQTARYVIIETTYDTPEDDPEKGAILEICEIQVYGCEIGKYGDGCRNCIGCQTCDVFSGLCTTMPCSADCVGDVCESTTGNCTNGCTYGYWGNRCTSTCPQNCQGGSCDRTSGYCNGCSDNYWGQNCSTICPQNCNGGVCDQSNEYCSKGCTQGRYGDKCEYTCNEKCSDNTCFQNSGVCTNGCADFYYGYRCEYECSAHCNPGRCDRYNGTCSGCSSGYFGSSCRDTCSVNCAEGTCDQQTGKCHGGCKPSWAEDQCDSELRFIRVIGIQFFILLERKNVSLSEVWFKVRLTKRIWTKRDTRIRKQHLPVKIDFGSDTLKTKHCTSENVQPSTTECDISMIIINIVLSVVIVLTGSAVNFLLWRRNQSAVTNTAQRTRCYTDRSTGLPDNIKDIPCNQTARYVIVETTYDAPEDDPVKGAVLEICEIQVIFFSFKGCDSAHYGLNCSQQCDVNCKDRVCNSNGFCTLGCKSGFYGNTCKNACPSCPSGCNRNSGDCEGTCPNDRYGKQCNLPCSPGCTGGCNRDTGACDRGCVVGKFGSNCSENCNTGCIADCDQNDGRCECKTGWQGDKCDDCRSDYHGHLCEQRCSSHCVNGICFSNNGTCVGGSAGKFSNDKCTQAFAA